MNKALTTVFLTAALGVIPAGVGAQAPQETPAVVKPAVPTLPDISLDLRDAPLRQALEQVFQAAKVDFSIDPSVSGFVTLKLTDQPFESALRLVMRGATTPLSYTREGNVYIVKPRVSFEMSPPYTPLPAELTVAPAPRSLQIEQIALIYLDPYDLQQILPIQFVPTGSRGNGAGMGGAVPGNGPTAAGSGPAAAGGNILGGSLGIVSGGSSLLAIPGAGSGITPGRGVAPAGPGGAPGIPGG